MPRHILAPCFAAALMAAASAAQANTVLVYGFAPTLGGQIVLQRIPVTYEPLASGDVRSAAALFARLSAAAHQVCVAGRPSALLTSKIDLCFKGAIRRAVRDVGSPELSAAAERD